MIRAIGRAVDRIPSPLKQLGAALLMIVLFWVIFGVLMGVLFGPFALVGQ